MQASYEHNGQRITAAQFYAVACDPRRSVAIEACAGAGKTWMLVSRMLRALLQDDAEHGGCEPHEILAITFTKKAAGEMRLRLQDWLAEFAHAEPDKLETELLMRGMSPESAKNKREVLQNLYQTLLGKGRGVQIRTFHGWFAALLRTAPLSVLQDLHLPAEYQLLEDDKLAVPGVWRRFFAALLANADAKQDFEDLVVQHGRFQALKALEEALSKRVEFALADEKGVGAKGVVEASVPHFSAFYPVLDGFETPAAALDTAIARQNWFAWAKELGSEQLKTPLNAAQAIIAAYELPDGLSRLMALRKAFFVATEDRLTQHLLKYPAAQQAEIELKTLCSAQTQHLAWQHQQRMSRLTRLLIAEFTALKRERGWVDMNDVERAAQHMLSDVDMSGWVQERLDARVKHLMIDEFQDTSPLQWQALYAWLAGYAGAGSTAPSVFIVGDPKQSIYRFRRAEPQVFIAAQQFVVDGLDGDLLSCDHTRRNAPEVIAAVNTTMQSAQTAGEYQDFRAHSTEATTVGSVAYLPQIQRDAVDAVEKSESDAAEPVWRDSLSTPRVIFEEKLITLECRQAAAFIAQQIQAGKKTKEIMVLARRRARLSEMQEALQALGIASQQPEKSELADAPEVQDVMALLDALVSPTHDLSLARALKSPLFGVSDDALVELALLQRPDPALSPALRQSWFEILISLQNSELLSEQLRRLGPVLTRWKGWLDDVPPHDALDAIFHEGDVLAKFASAAPATRRASVLANLRALLSAALDINAARYATPYAFVRAMVSGRSRAGNSFTVGDNSMVDVTQTVKAPVQSDDAAIRLLTIHGAKGLEAELVLMLDTDALPSRAATMSVLVDWPGEAVAPTSFVFLASESRPAPSVVDAFAVELVARKREELNALYVAMTRAKQQLVLSSVAPYREPGVTWWQRLQGLAEPCATLTPASAPPVIDASAERLKSAEIELLVLPELKKASNMPVASVKYASLAINNVANEGVKSGAKTATASPKFEESSLESRIGQAMHRLLQWLPDQVAVNHGFEAVDIKAVALEFELTTAQADQAAAMAQRIAAGEGAWSWDPAVVDWQGNELELFAAGQLLRLDRLVRRADTGDWWVLDYKSESQPQRKPELLAQLQAYRAAVQASQASSRVKAAFLTAAGQLIEVND